MKILIENAMIVTMDSQRNIYQNGYVLTEGNKILDAGEGDFGKNSGSNPSSGEEAPIDLRIDGQGGIVIPGFINTHCHVSMVPFRSLGDDCPDRLRRFLFPLEDEAMTKRLVYLGARYGICEMLLAGVTTFADMYYFEEEVAKACEELGIRGVLGQTVIGQPVCDSREAYGGLLLAEKFIREWKGRELVRPMIAPHGTNTNSPEALKAAFAIAEKYDTLYTLHASEMDYEMTYFREKFDQTPIGFLNDCGLLSPRTLAAHCIHLTEGDMDLLKKSGTTVSHCIGSNTKAGKGVAPVKELTEHQIPVGLGTDGPSSGNTLDLFTQLRLFASFHKTVNHDRALFSADKVAAFGITGGAEALHMEDEIGSLEPGKKADIVLIETKSANMFPCYNPCSALVYSANASNVDTVMVNGQILVRDKRLVNADLLAIREELEQEMGKFRQCAVKYADVV